MFLIPPTCGGILASVQTCLENAYNLFDEMSNTWSSQVEFLKPNEMRPQMGMKPNGISTIWAFTKAWALVAAAEPEIEGLNYERNLMR